METSKSVANIAVIGGGPGGLMTAYLLERKFQAPVSVTIFEASDRLGGKIVTGRFEKPGVRYEAGAAELYDYSAAGPDPLRELVAELGLKTYPMPGRAVFMRDRLLRSEADLATEFGERSATAYRVFVERACGLISPTDYYESDWQSDNGDPLATQSFDALLNSIGDERVRRYIEVAIHSDVAVEPWHTSAMYGLQNFLMNEPGYMSLYGIEGGIERLPREIARKLRARIRLNSPVQAVEAMNDETYRLKIGPRRTDAGESFDGVVVALPNYWIPAIDWTGPTLAKAMREHHAHYDYPAHYLRVTVLFKKPFWRETVNGSYFMLDAFGGCCVYDESARDTAQRAGVLGWLIAGDAAMYMNNFDDATLIRHVLDSLPDPLRHGRELFIEARVHRWIGAVNALPGGRPLREPDSRHTPDPANHPLLFAVGDYLFDSTLNGVLDSADCVAEWIAEELADETPAAVEEIAADSVVVK